MEKDNLKKALKHLVFDVVTPIALRILGETIKEVANKIEKEGFFKEDKNELSSKEGTITVDIRDITRKTATIEEKVIQK